MVNRSPPGRLGSNNSLGGPSIAVNRSPPGRSGSNNSLGGPSIAVNRSPPGRSGSNNSLGGPSIANRTTPGRTSSGGFNIFNRITPGRTSSNTSLGAAAPSKPHDPLTATSQHGTMAFDSRFETRAEFEAHCRKRGVCHICGQVRTHQMKKGFLKTKAAPLTVLDATTQKYSVYKGYCIQPTCYTLQGAKRRLGETLPQSGGGGGGRVSLASGDGMSTGRLSQQQQESSLGNSLSSFHFSFNNSGDNWTMSASSMDVSNTLDYSRQKLSPNEVQAVVRYKLPAPANVGIRTLLFDSCDLGDEGIAALVSALLEVQPPNLKVLCLRRNKIGPAGGKELARLFQQQDEGWSSSQSLRLETVRLSHNRIGDVGATPLFKAIENADHSTLKFLSLSYNNITGESASAMGAALAENNVLESLVLDHNRLRDPGVQALCTGLGRNSKSRLVVLSLCNNVIGDTGAQELAILLNRHQRTIEINVRRNEIGNTGAESLYVAMRNILDGHQSSSSVLSVAQGIDEANQVTRDDLLEQISTLLEERELRKLSPRSSLSPAPPQSRRRAAPLPVIQSPVGSDQGLQSLDSPQQLLEGISLGSALSAPPPPLLESTSTTTSVSSTSNNVVQRGDAQQFVAQSPLSHRLRKSNPTLYEELRQVFPDAEDLDDFLQEQMNGGDASGDATVDTVRDNPANRIVEGRRNSHSSPSVTAQEADVAPVSTPSLTPLTDQLHPKIRAEYQAIFPIPSELEAFLREEQEEESRTRQESASTQNRFRPPASSSAPASSSMTRTRLQDELTPSLHSHLQTMFPDPEDMEVFLRNQQAVSQQIRSARDKLT
jgi:Leucine Rich repeat